MISLQQLQSAGHLVLREALVDKNLRVSRVSSTSPQPATPKPESPLVSSFHFSKGKTQTQTGVVIWPLGQGTFLYRLKAKNHVQF